jgi:glutathionylspermidine synthase
MSPLETEGAPTADEATKGFSAFAARVVAEGTLTDPWLDGAPRLRERPLFVSRERFAALGRASEALAAAYNDGALLVADEPALAERFLGLSPAQRAMWLAEAPRWHGLARADVFSTREGLAFTEINSDTPTGEAEAVVLNALVASAHPGHVDPNAELEARFWRMLEHVVARRVEPEARRRKTVGIVYPTEFTEDLSLVRLYKRAAEERGWDVVLGSPYNLTRGSRGECCLFDIPVSLVLRHYKTDWWGERESAWSDEELPDTTPLTGPLTILLEAALDKKVAVVNPMGAVVTQNKRMMALLWEHVHKLPPSSQAVVRDHLPPTFRLEAMHGEQLRAEREAWVLKSDYGAEGDEVVLGRDTTADEWEQCLRLARPGRWVAQRYFEPLVEDADGVVNWGVFLVAGQTAGLYARVQRGATDGAALSVPVLLQ